VPDLKIGTALYELKGMRSDRSRANSNGAQVTGVEKREVKVKIPIEIQKQQAVDLDEKMFGVAAPAARQGGVRVFGPGEWGGLGCGWDCCPFRLAAV
jgi:hypothetical protein